MWNGSILAPPIVDWSPNLTAGSRSRSKLKSLAWDGETNTRPHAAHANDNDNPMIVNPCALCQLHSRRLHVPTLDTSGIPLCLRHGFTHTTQGTHWSGGWLRLGSDGNRFFDSCLTLLHCGFNGNTMKKINDSICYRIMSYLYISIILSNTFEARAKSHPSERKVPKKVEDLARAPSPQSLDLPYFSKFPHFYLQHPLGLRDIPS